MSHKILIVDDDPTILEVLETYLGQGLGYEVKSTASGEAALEAGMEESYHLCILDVRMPGLTGAETHMRLKKMQPELETIFFTADSDFENTMDFLRFSMPKERVISKPLDDLSQLTRLIISILGPPIS
jgi:DNA-binding NtrC family response regulator